jgi:hypothetical protein
MLDVLRKKPVAPERALHRSYQNALRAIGRYSDSELHRTVSLFEVQHGFILRAFSASTPPKVLALEIPEDDIQDLIIKNYAERSARPQTTDVGVLSGRYEDFFRALGFYLDKHNARSIAVAEMVDAVAVSFFELQSTNDSYTWEAESFVMERDGVNRLVAEATGRRASNR